MTVLVKLRGFQPEDASFIRSLVAEQGWNAGVHDVETFTAADPDAWIVAEIDGPESSTRSRLLCAALSPRR